MAPNAIDLTTLANAKAWLALAVTSDDALLAQLITAASAFIAKWLGRDLTVQTYTEIRSGQGGRQLFMYQTPVIAVSGVIVDGVTIPLAPDTTSPGYRVVGDSIVLKDWRFTRDLGNVQISYQAGYATIPYDIEQVCIELVSVKYKERKRIGLVSEALGGAAGAQTTAYLQADMTKNQATVLMKHKRVVFG